MDCIIHGVGGKESDMSEQLSLTYSPDHLTYLLRHLYVCQEGTVRTRHGTTDWFQIGKGLHQGCILSPCLFNFYSEYIMQNTGLDESQAGVKIAGRNINNLRYADDRTLMAENEDHGIRYHHFMGNRWGNSGNSVRLYFLGAPKSLQMVTAAMKLEDTYSLEGKL